MSPRGGIGCEGPGAVPARVDRAVAMRQAVQGVEEMSIAICAVLVLRESALACVEIVAEGSCPNERRGDGGEIGIRGSGGSVSLRRILGRVRVCKEVVRVAQCSRVPRRILNG